MIEKIIYKKKLLALIVRGKYRNKKGITFFTPNESTQQFGYMKHKKKYIIKPHLHKKRLTKILYTTEVILLLKGVLRVDFYNLFKKYLFSKVLKEKDIIKLKDIISDFIDKNNRTDIKRDLSETEFHGIVNYLESKNITYEEVNIEQDLEARQWILEQGHRTVPQIYINDRLVEGGFNGLVETPDTLLLG